MYSCENTVLETLQELENDEKRKVEDRSKQEQEEQEILELQEKVKKLRHQKSLLQKKLARHSDGILGDFINNMHDKKYVNNLPDNERKEIFNIANEIRCKKIRSLNDAHRLTGISIESESPSKINFRLDTFYQGQYKEAYYIEILSENQSLRVSQHTIPHVIPVSHIEQHYLNTAIEEFFSELLKHINKYAAKT